MKVYLIRDKRGINASGEYDATTKALTVLAGSVLSEGIAHTEKFRGANAVEKARDGIVVNRVLKKDITFKSASTAANFVTGSSTNGLIAWKDETGRSIKDLLTGVI